MLSPSCFASLSSFIAFKPSLQSIISWDCFKFIATFEPFMLAFNLAAIAVALSMDSFIIIVRDFIAEHLID